MKNIYIPFLFALALTACQENTVESMTPVVDNVMHFNLVGPDVKTKVNAGLFETADQIGLYVTDYVDNTTPMPLQLSGNRANNLTVTFDGSAWTPEKTIYWGTGRKSDVYAYYPYIAEIQDVESQFFSVAEDQTGEGYEASDLLWAKAEGVKQADGAVNLQMNHVMSKLTVKIVAGKDYIGSLPSDASVLLHSTVTGARVDLSKGSVSKDPYSGAKSIKMKNLGIRSFDGYDAVVYEAIVVPQLIETFVPLLEINSKSVSYLLEDIFDFRPGVSYTYTATLNTSTTAIKVQIGCELEDWNNAGGNGSGEGGESGGSGDGENDDKTYTDLSADGTANCYLIQSAGDYKFKSVIGNTDATVGNVKSVEVLWESFGTDQMPNVGDLIASVSYKDGYVRFSTPETFKDGNAVIAAKNSKGTILWSWHIWCAEEGWKEQVYYNNAGTMMDRNLGATSATPGDVSALGLLYQWGRKEPFLASSSISSDVKALSSGNWIVSSDSMLDGRLNRTAKPEANPMTFYTGTTTHYLPDGSWQSEKTAYDPCPAGWRVPEGGENGVWAEACGNSQKIDASSCFDDINRGANLSGLYGSDDMIWYPASGYYDESTGALDSTGTVCYCWSCSPTPSSIYNYAAYASYMFLSNKYIGVSHDYRLAGRSVRCYKID